MFPKELVEEDSNSNSSSSSSSSSSGGKKDETQLSFRTNLSFPTAGTMEILSFGKPDLDNDKGWVGRGSEDGFGVKSKNVEVKIDGGDGDSEGKLDDYFGFDLIAAEERGKRISKKQSQKSEGNGKFHSPLLNSGLCTDPYFEKPSRKKHGKIVVRHYEDGEEEGEGLLSLTSSESSVDDEESSDSSVDYDDINKSQATFDYTEEEDIDDTTFTDDSLMLNLLTTRSTMSTVSTSSSKGNNPFSSTQRKHSKSTVSLISVSSTNSSNYGRKQSFTMESSNTFSSETTVKQKRETLLSRLATIFLDLITFQWSKKAKRRKKLFPSKEKTSFKDSYLSSSSSGSFSQQYSPQKVSEELDMLLNQLMKMGVEVAKSSLNSEVGLTNKKRVIVFLDAVKSLYQREKHKLGSKQRADLKEKMTNAIKFLSDTCLTKAISHKRIKEKQVKLQRQKKIGEGGNARVYNGVLQRKKKLKIKCAVKRVPFNPFQKSLHVFNQSLSTQRKHEETMKRTIAIIEREIFALYENSGNKNCVKFYGYYFDTKCVNIVMDRCDCTLDEYLKRNTLSTKKKLGLILQVARALDGIHRKGYVHRDLKPENCLIKMVRGKPKIQIADFGSAKPIYYFYGSRNSLSGTTPHYLPPEGVNFNMVRDPKKLDIYSFGLLIWNVFSERSLHDEYCRVLSRSSGKKFSVVQKMAPFYFLAQIHQKELRPGFDYPEFHDVPNYILSIMTRCWSARPSHRRFFVPVNMICRCDDSAINTSILGFTTAMIEGYGHRNCKRNLSTVLFPKYLEKQLKLVEKDNLPKKFARKKSGD